MTVAKDCNDRPQNMNGWAFVASGKSAHSGLGHCQTDK